MFTAVQIRPDEQLLFSIPQCCAILCMSRTSIYREIRTGRLRSLAIGGKRRVSKQALIEYVAERERGE